MKQRINLRRLVVLVSLAVPCAALGAEFRTIDTIPPTASSPHPSPDSTVLAGGDVTVSARIADEGDGLDPASLQLRVDDRDQAAHAQIAGDVLTWRPTTPLSKGIHHVDIRIRDKAGNDSNPLSWQFGVDTPVKVTAKFDAGQFLLNGKPFFPLTMYNLRCNVDRDEFDQGKLAQIADAGFNSLDGGNGSQKGLDACLKYGVKEMVAISVGELRKCTDPEQAREIIAKGPTRFKDHPALLGYWTDAPEVIMEAEQKVPRADALHRLALARDAFHQIDPDHPVIWSLAWKDTYGDYIGVSDAMKTFFYPIRPGGMPLASVADFLLPAARKAAGDKQVWFTAQAFDFVYQNTGNRPDEKYLRPTIPEMRAMCFLALTQGVNQLTLYASGGTVKPGVSNDLSSYPENWAAAMQMASQIRYLMPALAAGKRAATVEKGTHYSVHFEGTAPTRSASEDQGSIRFVELEHDRVHTLIAVNVTEFIDSATWNFKSPCKPIVLFENRALAQRTQSFQDQFLPFQVHVYQWAE